jgi:hypothetical protein
MGLVARMERWEKFKILVGRINFKGRNCIGYLVNTGGSY